MSNERRLADGRVELVDTRRVEASALYRLEDLYLENGAYRGWNWRAIAATALGCALAWSGLIVAPLRPLYDYAWFVGFLAAGLAYLALATGATARAGDLPESLAPEPGPRPPTTRL
jgi:cytosine/uracil/thiamine/allantoin permease